MRKYKKVVILLIICVLVISGFIFIKTWKKPYTKADYDLVNIQEKEKLEYFYDGSIPVSKGKYFDMRYLYYDGESHSNMKIEVVKKVEENIKIDEITIYNKKGKEILFVKDSFWNSQFPKREKGRPNIIWTYDNFQYYGYLLGYHLFFLNDVFEDISLTPPPKYAELNEISIKLKMGDNVEKHKLVFDRNESLNTLSKVNEWKHGNLEDTKSDYLSYYFGLLMKEDFVQWKKEVELLLNDDNAKEYSWSLIFNLPSSNVEKYPLQQLQEYFEFNDEEFKEYLFYFKSAVDKGLIFKGDLNKMSYKYD